MKIALLGAESTGKTELAHALAAHFNTQGCTATAVDEYLREWCDAHARTPQQHEQITVATEQQRRIEAAASKASWVFADTTPLMTAIYSEFIFHDRSLHPQALAYQRSFDLTLLTGLDMPWQPDGIQRDGPQVRGPVDALLRKTLQEANISFKVIYGLSTSRLQHALEAVSIQQDAIKSRAKASDSMPTKGLKPSQNWQWQCDKCSDPECEHRLFRRLMASG
jgi:nicotinamide riboside kinase